jgi:hypothetical protein
MKKLINILVLISVFVFAGMQNVNAQKSVRVFWDNDDCDECTISGGFWRVALEVYDDCGTPPSQVYVQVQYLSESSDEAVFQLTHFCDSQSQEACYFVVASLEKYCPDGHGGYTLTCSGKNPGVWKSCPFLMGSGSFDLGIIFQ